MTSTTTAADKIILGCSILAIVSMTIGAMFWVYIG